MNLQKFYTSKSFLFALAVFLVILALRIYGVTNSSKLAVSPSYSNSALGFSINIPKDYTTDESYLYQALGPGKDIKGVKFTIPESLSEGTNLGSDSYLSVEEIPGAAECSASMFLEQGTNIKSLTENGVDYSFAFSSGAAAGNRYDETVYAIPGSDPCLAIRYFIHYSVFENYPEGAVRRFDEQALINQFDQIRRTLTINQ
jgi:hypothetical protein